MSEPPLEKVPTCGEEDCPRSATYRCNTCSIHICGLHLIIHNGHKYDAFSPDT